MQSDTYTYQSAIKVLLKPGTCCSRSYSALSARQPEPWLWRYGHPVSTGKLLPFIFIYNNIYYGCCQGLSILVFVEIRLKKACFYVYFSYWHTFCRHNQQIRRILINKTPHFRNFSESHLKKPVIGDIIKIMPHKERWNI